MGKPTSLLVISFFLSLIAFSQKKFELSVFTGSGFSCFTGSGAVNSSTYHRSGLVFPNDSIGDQMAQPYGRKPVANFIAGLQADLKLYKWMLALSAEYERSGGALDCDSVISPSNSIQTSGKYTRRYEFISINPQIGRIIIERAVTIGILAGIDYTCKLAMGNQFDYSDQNGMKNSIGYSGDEPEVNDLRLTLGASVTRKKWTLGVVYKRGLTNYNPSGNGDVNSRLFQIRIQYTFLQKAI